jgi:hypothetical protein
MNQSSARFCKSRGEETLKCIRTLAGEELGFALSIEYSRRIRVTAKLLERPCATGSALRVIELLSEGAYCCAKRLVQQIVGRERRRLVSHRNRSHDALREIASPRQLNHWTKANAVVWLTGLRDESSLCPARVSSIADDHSGRMRPETLQRIGGLAKVSLSCLALS